MKTVAFSALAAVFLAGSAHAAETETVSVIVPYNDLDLTSDAGQAALETRIDAAVKEVCAKPEVMRNLKAMASWTECRKDAAASAAEQIGAADMATETFAVLF